jgi:phosphatidylserine decarboxylase
MTPALRRALSRLVGWLADRRVPTPLRRTLYGAFARWTGANLAEVELALEGYPSLSAFFVRRLRAGARPIDPDGNTIVSPCDGTLQALGRIEQGTLLQAKGQYYPVEELLGSSADASAGAWAFTIYLGPRDYHRVHVPLAAELVEARWLGGDRRSVAPGVLARRARLLATNERTVLRLVEPRGSWFLVLVGALNVGRIRVVGVAPSTSPARPVPLAKGAELGRFELGSTVVLVAPPGAVEPREGLLPGARLRLGQPIAVRTEARLAAP